MFTFRSQNCQFSVTCYCVSPDDGVCYLENVNVLFGGVFFNFFYCDLVVIIVVHHCNYKVLMGVSLGSRCVCVCVCVCVYTYSLTKHLVHYFMNIFLSALIHVRVTINCIISTVQTDIILLHRA